MIAMYAPCARKIEDSDKINCLHESANGWADDKLDALGICGL